MTTSVKEFIYEYMKIYYIYMIYPQDVQSNVSTCQENVKSFAILSGRQTMRRRRSAVAREARNTLVGF